MVEHLTQHMLLTEARISCVNEVSLVHCISRITSKDNIQYFSNCSNGTCLLFHCSLTCYWMPNKSFFTVCACSSHVLGVYKYISHRPLSCLVLCCSEIHNTLCIIVLPMTSLVHSRLHVSGQSGSSLRMRLTMLL